MKIRFQEFDWFTKVQEDLKIRTTFSSIVTIIITVICTVFILSELGYYLSDQPTMEVGIDQTGIQKLDVGFRILLPSLRCERFGVDLSDSAGSLNLEVSKEIQKQHYGETGCRISGKLHVNRIAGEFHVAFGREAAQDGHAEHGESMEQNHVHYFTMEQAKNFNCSHIVESLDFNTKDFNEVNPLDGHSEYILQPGSARYVYYIKVIATRHYGRTGGIWYSNTFTYYLHKEHVNTMASSFRQPGIYFKYEIEPYVVNYRPDDKSILEFLLRCTATVGGVYVVAGWFSSLYYYLSGAKKKLNSATHLPAVPQALH